MADTRLVRLKPYSKKKGHLLRRYTYKGIKFDHQRGWYRVAKPIADYLAEVRQTADDPDTPLAFDVCTDDEARAMDEAETDANAEGRNAERPIDATEPVRPRRRGGRK
ncbi:MAG: hypothetical protein MJE77_41395 [Proteobacteria bacterium]|nr:hypothetical protein [Pseudomonadota bacterium]